MGVIVTKDDNNSKLTERINADLRARAVEMADGADPDLVEDSDYTETLEKTNSFAWVWIVLVVLALISLVVIVLV